VTPEAESLLGVLGKNMYKFENVWDDKITKSFTQDAYTKDMLALED